MKDRIRNRSTEDANGCWLFNGSMNERGYGKLGWDGKTWRAHRASYVAFVGPIPEGMLVLHNCGVRACVNPDHLRLGSAQDNSDDIPGHGRRAGRKRTLTEDQYAEIRRRYVPRKHGVGALAAEFGITVRHLRKIVSGDRCTPRS